MDALWFAFAQHLVKRAFMTTTQVIDGEDP